jgi:hypothetical protein
VDKFNEAHIEISPSYGIVCVKTSDKINFIVLNKIFYPKFEAEKSNACDKFREEL